MALNLVTNPVGSGSSKFFAGFQPCEFVFKREDIAVIDVEAGTGGAKFNHAGDLTTVLAVNDVIYVYSEGTNYTYDGPFEILEIAAGEITVDTAFIESATGGYMNYLKNYHVELQCVHPTLSAFNLLPFSLQSDGDAAGNVVIDVSIINELNEQRGAISESYLSAGVTEFEVKYREVYEGSSNSFTLVDNKLLIMLFAIDEPVTGEVLNQFDLPKLFLGYKAALVIANEALIAETTKELVYSELDINENIIDSGTLGSLDADVNGFLMWEWTAAASVSQNTKFIRFDVDVEAFFDFAATDFDYPDFLTQ
jgi:hypothetical protein